MASLAYDCKAARCRTPFPCKFRRGLNDATHPAASWTDGLFISRLDELINSRHSPVNLAALIDWTEIERTFGASLTSGRSRAALLPRLVAGVLYLRHTFDASDKTMVNT